jgi:hypothetical protein
MVSLCESIKILKGILSATEVFQSRDSLLMVQRGLLNEVEETHVSL